MRSMMPITPDTTIPKETEAKTFQGVMVYTVTPFHFVYRYLQPIQPISNMDKGDKEAVEWQPHIPNIPPRPPRPQKQGDS